MNHPKSSLWSIIGWVGIYVLLMLSIITPLNIVAIHLILVPVLVLFMKLEWKWFIPAYLIALAILYALLGDLGLILVMISLFFLPPVLVMGYGYKQRKPPQWSIMAGTFTMMAVLIVFLIIARIIGYDLVQDLKDVVLSNIEMLPAAVQEQVNTGQIDQLVFLLSQMIPFFIVAFSVYYIVITHWLSRKLANTRQEVIPALPPVRNWRLPRALVWYYIICILLDLFVPNEPGAFLTMVLLNLFPLLTWAFIVQAVSFVSFYVHLRKKSKALPVLLVIVVIFLPPTQYIASLIGLFDVMFPLRQRMSNNNKE
ncbi:DUF2232 domain-containing protein [Paenibacillus senegalensis]|uniref:DUF2232 domain-containing protein n=1 Tax=Paenibacillus senegalensis TaxID=1465766 RepID=UPI000287EEA1|nr:DUF2232 domain-containing protein [Paenibacillus senegalensis]